MVAFISPAPTDPGARRYRRTYWAAVLVALVGVAAGVLLAVRGYAATGGPAGVARAYFAALAESDAAGALGFGDAPAGHHDLLTAAVLREQQAIAPIRDVGVTSTRTRGDTATVVVDYTLAFADQDVPAEATVALHHSMNSWRLDRTAVATRITLSGAADRALLAGGSVPHGRVLLFPGALPLRFDSPYLAAQPSRARVGFDSPATTAVPVDTSPAGRIAVADAVRSAVGDCLHGRGDDSCPQPTERYVPNSVRGHLIGPLRRTTITLTDTAVGTFEFDGYVLARATYRRLDFYNRVQSGSGRPLLALHALVTGTTLLTVRWTRT